MRVGLYARVSTFDQDPELQLRELRDLAAQRHWASSEYVDHGVSGTRFRRPGLDRLLADVQAGRVDVVVVWRLDRLGRSMLDLVSTIGYLSACKVQFLSVRDPGMDTTSPAGRLLIQILSAFAEFERNLLSERTKAGMARARVRGSRLGRPRESVTPEQVRAKLAELGTVRAAAEALGVSRGTIRARLKVAEKVSATPPESRP